MTIIIKKLYRPSPDELLWYDYYSLFCECSLIQMLVHNNPIVQAHFQIILLIEHKKSLPKTVPYFLLTELNYFFIRKSSATKNPSGFLKYRTFQHLGYEHATLHIVLGSDL